MIARRWGWVMLVAGAVATVVVVLAGALGGHLGRVLGSVPLTPVYYLTGVAAFLRQPAHRAARRLLAMGVVLTAAYGLGAVYSAYVELRGVPSWAGVAVLVILAVNWATSAAPLALFAAFPDGAYHRPYERRLVVAAVVAVPVLAALEVVGRPELSRLCVNSVVGAGTTAVAFLPIKERADV
jgi:hypothetical protein